MRFEKIRPIDDVRREVRDKLRRDFDAICEGRSPTNGKPIIVECEVNGTVYVMNAGEKSATRMDAGVRTAQALGELHMMVRDAFDVDHSPVPVEEAASIRNQQASDARRYWLRKSEIVRQIEAAETVKALREIDTNFYEVTL